MRYTQGYSLEQFTLITTAFCSWLKVNFSQHLFLFLLLYVRSVVCEHNQRRFDKRSYLIRNRYSYYETIGA